jgi:CRP-like cAMP-binding protein
LWWATLVDEATLREALVNIGRRDAEQRVSHLICELHLRLQAVGLANGGDFDLPLIQAELADAVGISAVHANRTLQSLRQQNLIRLAGRSMTILDVPRLRSLCGFNPNYLHLEGGKYDTA